MHHLLLFSIHDAFMRTGLCVYFNAKQPYMDKCIFECSINSTAGNIVHNNNITKSTTSVLNWHLKH